MSFLRIIIIFTISCLLQLNGKLYSQTDFYFSHLGVEDGLSQVSVIQIFQDSDGYLWFGTRNGLNKYDGYEFHIFRNEVNNSNSLSDRYIRCINEDKNKNIWVGTSNGINCIEYGTGNIRRFYPRQIDSLCRSNAASYILSHKDGNMYMIERKCVFLCQSQSEVVLYKMLDEDIRTIKSLVQDPNGDIYIGTDLDGLFIYSENWVLKQQIKPGEFNMPHSHITAILPDENGIWLGTEDKGVCYYDKNTKMVLQYNSFNTGLGNNTIRSLIFLNKDSIMIGTFSGLNILRKKDMVIEPLSMNMQGQGGLSHYSIHSMLLDKDNTLWIGTYSAGINFYSPYYKHISYITSNEYAGIIGNGKQDKRGDMWFATEGAGLLYYNPRTLEQELYPLMPLKETNYERNILKSVLIPEGEENILCTTHFGSVYSFSIPQKKYKLLYDYKENDINTLYIDSKKRLWIPTMTSSHTVVIDNGKEVNRFSANGNEVFFPLISAINEIEPGKFVLGSLNDSLYLYDENKSLKKNIFNTLPQSIQRERLGTISSIIPDSSFIWVSTTRSGILRFDYDLNLQKQYLPADGLSDSYITSLIIDSRGDLWAATVNEIFKLNRLIDQFFPVKPADVPTQEFSLHAGTVSSDGMIYFPASRGVLAFNPDKLKDNPIIPPVYITSLITNNNEDILYQMKPTGDNQNRGYRFALKSDQNNLAIRYAALNYIHADGNQYMYKMDGVDYNWHNVGNRREAYYSNLHPGNYTFRVKASNSDGLWNPIETTLHITVKPPVYKSWWAYTLYVLIILFIGFQIYRYQHRKHELERDIRYKQKEQERMKELHEERLRMFNNFSHELRTPLTLIINPLEELLQSVSFSPEVKQALSRMKKNTKRMLMLVNNLMDVQKYEAGKSNLRKTRFNMSAFVRDIYQSFAGIAAKRNIEFVLQNDLPEIYTVYYDDVEIEKVFFNLLSNAFKFTPSGGRVTLLVKRTTEVHKISLDTDKNYIYIEVNDTGKGFSSEEAQKIFEPFYRFKDDIHQQISGTGIGLSLTRSIVSQHQGEIRAESSGEGARFMIFLPDIEIQQSKELPPSYPVGDPKETNKKTMLLLEEAETKNKPVLLIVDDDAEIRDYLKQQLSAEYKIIQATNGREALNILKSSQPQLVISDVIMPEMNGMELCRQIKTTSSLSSIPVILLTAKSMTSQIEEGLDMGADDYITKPFQISLLKARVRNLLSSSKKKTKTEDKTNILEALGIDMHSTKDDFLTQYIAIVKDNISNPELDISLIYETLGMSRANFYRKVKSLTGLSPIEFIRNIRLEVGAELLRETDLNVSEIAQRTGFSSRSYFARNFKSVYGVSPSEYQESHKQ